MKSIIVIIGGLGVAASLATAATAADLRAAPPYKAPAAVVMGPVYTWSGLYVGGHAGGGWARSRWRFLEDSVWNLAAGDTLSINSDGWLAGGQIGFNYQFGQWLAGVEGTWSGADLSKTIVSPFFPTFDTETAKVKTLYTVTGRIGVIADRWLAYFKGGWAGGRVEISGASTLPTSFTSTATRSGWVIGGGIEYMFAPYWILGVEYNYVDLGSKTYNTVATIGAPANIDVDTQVHSVVARLSYLFNWRR